MYNEYVKSAINAIYWKMHTFYLRNNQDKAKYMLDLLESEIGSTTEFIQDIGPIQYKRYLKIKDNITNGNFGQLTQGFASPGESLTQYTRSTQESDFCNALARRPQTMLSLLGLPEKTSLVREYDMAEFGRCDFLARHNKVWYPIEVKVGAAPTSIVSQIDRYRICAELEMCMGLHDEVVTCVLAEGFGPYVAAELARAGVLMIEHHGDPSTLKLLRA